MALIYAPVCTTCHKYRTQHPSGICSRCRRLWPQAVCQLCGNKVRCGQEFCSECRKRFRTPLDIAEAIAKQEQYLNILKLRQENRSFEEISQVVGLSKSSVYGAYRRMMHLPERVSMEAVAAIERHPDDNENQ